MKFILCVSRFDFCLLTSSKTLFVSSLYIYKSDFISEDNSKIEKTF